MKRKKNKGLSQINNSYKELLKAEEAAEYLRVPLGSFNHLVRSGKLKHYKIGRLNRFLMEDLIHYALANQRGGRSK